MLVARIASRAASACRSRAALPASACRGRAALTARHLSDAAKQHERALEALDAGAPPEAVVPLFEAAAAEGHAEATFFVGLAKAGLLEPDDGTVGGSPPEVDLEGAAAAYAKAAELGCAPASKASSARSCCFAAASERWRTVSAARLRYALAARPAMRAMSICLLLTTRIATFDSRQERAFTECEQVTQAISSSFRRRLHTTNGNKMSS